jgi:hypothetical protein
LTLPPQTPQPPQRDAPRASTTAPRKGDVDRAVALRDVMDHAVKMQKDTASARWIPRSGSRSTVLTVICALLAAFSAYSWIARPEFVWGPKANAEPVRQDAEARLSIYFISRRIEALKKRDGAYPATIASLMRPGSTVQYRVLSDSTYELLEMLGSRPLVYRSDTPMNAFLGNAARIITAPTK